MMKMFFLLLLLLQLFFLFSICCATANDTMLTATTTTRHHHPTILTDKAALLGFKAALSQQSQALLADWQDDDDVCSFRGVVCNHQRHRVVGLRLNRTGIHGPISPFLSNLTLLRSLDLSENHLVGPIPPELGFLRLLAELNLCDNFLHGPIPGSLSLASELFFLDLHDNPLLTGSIPTSIFYNCTSLAYIDLSINSLQGQIPSDIGNRLPSLQILQLYSNHLTGNIPLSLSNCTFLEWLDVENNSLSGELPSQTLGALQSLQFLLLSNNHFTSHDHNTNLSPFFAALSNCTFLASVELAGNGIGGRLPSTIDTLGRGPLSSIYLQDNLIVGYIPPNIANLSNLTLLNLSTNILNGTIPVQIGGLRMLQQLILSNNWLTGSIPSSIGQARLLLQLDLSRNGLTGEIPASIGNLVFLSELFLQENKLSGPIPSAIGNCKSLNKLDLSFNRLTAGIPKEILGLSSIGIFLNFSHNLLSGPLPLELSKMEAIQEIDLSSNGFNGSIFPQVEGCIAVRAINLSHNRLQGKLPDSIAKLRNLESLDVSHNLLSGEIPTGLGGYVTLTLLNLSYNDFSGCIPTSGRISNFSSLSFLGNPHLCGMMMPGVPVCRKKKRKWSDSQRKLVIVASAVASSSAILILSTLTCCCKMACKKTTNASKKWGLRRKEEEISSESIPASAASLKLSFPRITYKELAEATGEFEQGRLIGCGSFGHVYRGILKDGNMVAIKVLHLQTGNLTKTFNRECEVLKRIRHRNLMRIITACSLPDFKALVLPFMANGSLESHLYHEGKSLEAAAAAEPSIHLMNLVQRVSICRDIAEGMAYLHHHSPVRVIHCDLKPSNVLLNDDMTALVTDFGIARLVTNVGGSSSRANNGHESENNGGNSTANLLRGSLGYIAPEYGYGSTASTKGDVYSFGILVLEMVTRRRPTDEMFVGELSLHNWVKRHYHGRVEKVIDPCLIRSLRDQDPDVQKMWEVAVAELIELGILCTQEAPSTRPTMLDAADDLDRLKRYLTGDSSTTATFASSLGISSSTVFDDHN